jgi:hypothetical protein
MFIILKLCCLGASTVLDIQVLVHDTTFSEKLMYVHDHKLKYKYVSGTDTGTYPLPVLSLKWSIRAL